MPTCHKHVDLLTSKSKKNWFGFDPRTFITRFYTSAATNIYRKYPIGYLHNIHYNIGPIFADISDIANMVRPILLILIPDQLIAALILIS